MDAPTSPSTPLGPMTRARAKAIEDKVNSLLSELPLSTHETWLLPHMDTLCVIRYLEESHGTAAPNGQGGKDTKHEHQEEEPLGKLQAPDDWPGPDVRPLKVATAKRRKASQSSRHRTTGEPWMSDELQVPYDRPTPDDRRYHSRAKTPDFRRPPDDRRPGHPTPTGPPSEAYPSRIYGRPIGTGRPDPLEPPDDR